ADELGTHRIVRKYLGLIGDIVESYGGRVVNYAGDAVLAEFGTVAEAVTSAVVIQREMADHNEGSPDDRQVRFRIGINLGDVIVDGADIFGDGVNVAARVQSLAEPGGICITDSVRLALGTKLALQFEDLGPQKAKNISEPVRAWRVRAPPEVALPAPTTKARPPGRSRRWWLVALLALPILAIAGGLLLWWFYAEQPPADTALALPEEPSIAVLPFRNLSDDTEQEFFVDGLTEDLITDLAKLSGLFVISRNSVFTYKGQAVTAPQVARELGVRYVLEGSVRRAADRLRVTAQLIDAVSDRPLWAERYDRRLDDVFAVQDALKQQIVAALTVELNPGERAQLAKTPTENIEAYEYYLRGRQAMYRLSTTSLRTAYWALEKAIALDPNFAAAYATLALASALDYRGMEQWNDWVRPPGRARAQAIQQARKASALNPALALPELALAYVQLADRKYDDALAQVEQAIARAPGDSWGYETRARVLTAAGRHQEALGAMEQALRLDPKPPALFFNTLGRVRFALKDYASAAESLEKAEKAMIAEENWQTAYYLHATYAYLGRTNELEELHQTWMFPQFNLTAVRMDAFYQHDEDMEHYLTGLRRAGVAEFPYGFQPAEHANERINGTQLRDLLYGRSFQAFGSTAWLAAEFHFSKEGLATWKVRHDISDTSTSRVEGDGICFRFSLITRGREACYQVFRNPADDRFPEREDYEYVMVGPELYYLNSYP
ncbi:MAG: adenylate cyclase protein, partial [Geminicoccaceae bacterium]|nr:adenylate cyclase protein [Geminicoccaceae bacterium]